MKFLEGETIAVILFQLRPSSRYAVSLATRLMMAAASARVIVLQGWKLPWESEPERM